MAYLLALGGGISGCENAMVSCGDKYGGSLARGRE